MLYLSTFPFSASLSPPSLASSRTSGFLSSVLSAYSLSTSSPQSALNPFRLSVHCLTHSIVVAITFEMSSLNRNCPKVQEPGPALELNE